MDDFFGLDYFELKAWEVTKRDWPFAVHLNQLFLRWKYLRRVLRIVKCVNPATGIIDTPFEALIDSVEWGDCPQHRWVDSIQQSFSTSTSELETGLAKCVSVVSPRAFRLRIELWKDLLIDEDLEELKRLASEGARLRREGSWQYAFFFAEESVSATVGAWEEKLRNLRDGDYERLWKQGKVLRGASDGGRKGAATMRRQRIASPDEVMRQHERLLSEGAVRREIAATIADRLGIHPDHVRRLRRQAEAALEKPKPTHRG